MIKFNPKFTYQSFLTKLSKITNRLSLVFGRYCNLQFMIAIESALRFESDI